MSVYLYHPKYFGRANRVHSIVDPIHKRLYEEQCTMPSEEWDRLYKRASKIDAKVERGCYMQWCTLQQHVLDVPRPEDDFKKFSFREMREIRRRIRRVLADGFAAFYDYRWDHSYASNLTFACWTNTFKWAEEIFSNGLKDNQQVYLA